MTAAVRLRHTHELDAGTRGGIRRLLDGAFDDLEDDDWEHALGGVHALVTEGPDVVAHGSVVQRRLLHGGRALRAGYVEAVAVRADRRRRGLGTSVMAALEGVARRAYDVAALGATDEALPLYTGRGWQVWRGPLRALTPAGTVPTPDEAGAVLVLPLGVALDLDAPLTCDWRDGDVW